MARCALDEAPGTPLGRRWVSAARRISVAAVVHREDAGRFPEAAVAAEVLRRAAVRLDDRRGELDAFLALCRCELAAGSTRAAVWHLEQARALARQVEGYPAGLMAVFAELAPEGLPPARSALDRQLVAWRGAEPPAAVLRRGALAWTRLHGLISLDVQGQFALTGVDPELLFRAELDAILAEPW